MDKNRKILIGVLASVVLLCAVIGITGASFRAGMLMNGARNGMAFGPGRQQNYGPQAGPQPVAPQDDQPPVAPQAPRGDARRAAPQAAEGYYANDARFNRSRGFGVLGFIGGIFRFIGTLLLIGLIFFFIRMAFFKRGWGMGRWGWGGRGGPNGQRDEHRGVPPHFEEWHKRMHEQGSNPQQAAPDASATKPAEADVTDDKPQNPQAL